MPLAKKLRRFAGKPLPDKWSAIKATFNGARQANFGADPSVQILHELREIRKAVERSAILAKEQYVTQSLGGERYADPKRLERYGFKVYSQYDEDGIIQEIFRRIGTTDRRFIEFGVEDGLENNTLKLLLEGWRGLWIEGNGPDVAAIKSRFAGVLDCGRLTVQQAFIKAGNINGLIGPWGDGEIDFVSIDIDGNDFYVWQALKVVRPRAVVIEYNGKFSPSLAIAQAYDPINVWKGTDYMGASLEALARLGRRLGYSLVGTNFPGINAFFVRDDLTSDKFQCPFSAENHYNRARYFLWQLYVAGHPPDWGTYVNVPDVGPDQQQAES